MNTGSAHSCPKMDGGKERRETRKSSPFSSPFLFNLFMLPRVTF